MRSFVLFAAFVATAAAATATAAATGFDTVKEQVYFLDFNEVTTSTDALALAGMDLSQLQSLQAHYGSPADGCEADEMMIRIQGVPGAICSAKCTDSPCPTDVPDGVTAAPTCALHNPATDDKYCVLLCSPGTDTKADTKEDVNINTLLRGAIVYNDNDNDVQIGQCGDATCQPVQGAGVCTYGSR